MNRRRALLTTGAGLIVPWRLYAQPVPLGGPAGYQRLGPGPLWAGVPGAPPTLDLNFLSATLDPSITWTRTQNTATDGLFTDGSGTSFNTFLANAPRISVANGLLIEGQRTNVLLNSSAPVTQTTASLGVGTYSLWVNGAGSATPSAGTATGSGFAAASQGAPSTFTLTVAGTVVVTKTGALNRFQLEAGLDVSSYVPTAGVTAVRPIDVGTLPVGAWFNAASGTMVWDFLQPQLVAGNTYVLPSLWIDSNNALELRLSGANAQGVSWLTAASNAALVASGAMSTGIVQRVALSYDAGSKIISISLNGGPVGAVVTPGVATFTQLKFGVVRVGPSNGFVRRIRYYPRVLQIPEMRAVTSL